VVERSSGANSLVIEKGHDSPMDTDNIVVSNRKEVSLLNSQGVQKGLFISFVESCKGMNVLVPIYNDGHTSAADLPLSSRRFLPVCSRSSL